MENKFLLLLKQLGKALCYYALFLGCQSVLTILYTFYTMFTIMLSQAMSGSVTYDAETASLTMQRVLEKTNIIVIISTILSLLILWLFFLIRRKKLTTESGIVPFQPKLLPVLLLLALGLTGFVNTILNLLPESWVENYMEVSDSINYGSFPVVLISTCICAPVLEEIIFRGLILSRLKKAMPTWVAILISSVLFGLAHGQILWITYATLLGVILCLVKERTGSISATMLIHALFNTFGTLISYIWFDIPAIVFYAVLIAGLLIMALALYLLSVKKEPELIKNSN